MNSTDLRPDHLPATAAATKREPQSWKDNLGKRLLLQAWDDEDAVFEALLLDHTDAGFIRVQLGANREWKNAGNYRIVQTLDGSLAGELEAKFAADAVEVRAQRDRFNSELNAACALNVDLNNQVRDLTERLNAALADNVIKANSLEPLIGKVVAANAKRNDAIASFEAERDSHATTKRELGIAVTDRDNARGALDLEQRAHRDSIRTLTDRAVAAESDPDLLAMRQVKEIASGGVTVEISHPVDAPNLDASTVVTVWNGDAPKTAEGRSVAAALAKVPRAG